MMKLKTITRSKPLKITEDPNTFWKFDLHQFDIDIIKNYKKLVKLFNSSIVLKDGITKENYLNILKDNIKFYCMDNDYNYTYHFENANLFIPNTSKWYPMGLTIQLICLDIYQIRPFLDHHKEKYIKIGNFVSLIKFRVCDMVGSNSPFQDMREKQEFIMKWVEDHQRGSSKTMPITNTFEGLFRNESYAQRVVKILMNKKFLNEDGSWDSGFSNKSSEVTALIKVLEDKNYLKKNPKTTIANVFKFKFKLELSIRSLCSETNITKDIYPEYAAIIPDLK